VALLVCAAASPAQTYEASLLKIQARVQSLQTYSCTFTSFSRGAEKTDEAVFQYYFKKPGSVRMKALSGNHEGTVLLYTGSDVRVKPGHGIFSLFSFSFAPTHKYVCDARGNGVHQSSWVYYIEEHLLMRQWTRSRFKGIETIGGRRALAYELTSVDPEKTRSIAVEQVWIDADRDVLLQYKEFDKTGTLVQSGLYENIAIASALNDSLFTQFAD
jgi:outer membrane lipoprotein-sorting protein